MITIHGHLLAPIVSDITCGVGDEVLIWTRKLCGARRSVGICTKEDLQCVDERIQERRAQPRRSATRIAYGKAVEVVTPEHTADRLALVSAPPLARRDDRSRTVRIAYGKTFQIEAPEFNSEELARMSEAAPACRCSGSPRESLPGGAGVRAATGEGGNSDIATALLDIAEGQLQPGEKHDVSGGLDPDWGLPAR